jgi:hypothetical protein
MRRETIAQNQNTYEKRKREMDKKAKAEAKRARRTQRKQGIDTSEGPQSLIAEANIRNAAN